MERLTTGEYDQCPGSWSWDGKTIALTETRPDTGNDIYILDVLSGRVTPFLNSKFNERSPDFSPDGPWLAYTSDESGRFEVYVRSFPAPDVKHLVSAEGGDEPLWARDGKRLFYRWQGQVWVVDVWTEGRFATSKPRLLFDRPGYGDGYPIRNYDISLDSQRFLMVKVEQREPSPATEMTLVQSWFAELNRLLPMK